MASGSSGYSRGPESEAVSQVPGIIESLYEGVKYSSYNLTASTPRAIVTVAVGGEYFYNWQEKSFENWKAYADKFDLAIIVVRDRLAPPVPDAPRNPAWDKLLAPSFVKRSHPGISEICLLDTDFAIGPLAPNIFDYHVAGSYSVVSQEKALPFPIGPLRARIAILRQLFYDSNYPIDSVLRASARQVFEIHKLPAHDDYFCSGLIVLDDLLFEDLRECFFAFSDKDIELSVAWEEPFVNHWIQSRRLTWLPYEYQAIWLFEMAWSYPSLYLLGGEVGGSENVVDALSATLLNRHFLHFAGSWHEASVWGSVPRLQHHSLSGLEKELSQVVGADVQGLPAGKFPSGMNSV